MRGSAEMRMPSKNAFWAEKSMGTLILRRALYALMKYLVSLLAIFLTFGIVQAQTPALNWSNTYFRPGFDLNPYVLTTKATGAGKTRDVLVGTWALPLGIGAGGGMVVNPNAGTALSFTTGVDILTGFDPASIVNAAPAPGGSDIRVFGKQYEVTGTNARYLGGGSGQISGPLDFEYQVPNTPTAYVLPLAVAPRPYADFSCANIQTTPRGLAIFHTQAGQTNP